MEAGSEVEIEETSLFSKRCEQRINTSTILFFIMLRSVYCALLAKKTMHFIGGSLLRWEGSMTPVPPNWRKKR